LPAAPANAAAVAGVATAAAAAACCARNDSSTDGTPVRAAVRRAAEAAAAATARAATAAACASHAAATGAAIAASAAIDGILQERDIAQGRGTLRRDEEAAAEPGAAAASAEGIVSAGAARGDGMPNGEVFEGDAAGVIEESTIRVGAVEDMVRAIDRYRIAAGKIDREQVG
jgi:hypothetical protein